MATYSLALCAAATVDQLPLDTNKWVLEPKIDGHRVRVEINADGHALYTRTDHIATGKMPKPEALFALLAGSNGPTVLDGEAVVLVDGRPDFNRTAQYLGSGTDTCVRKQTMSGHYVTFICFDILVLDGQDLRSRPYTERRALVEQIASMTGGQWIQALPQATPTLANHMRFVAEYGEGSVAKRLDSMYPRGRSQAWLKFKRVETTDCVITGFDPGKGKYADTIGAVRFSQIKDGRVTEIGRCSGMSDAERYAISANPSAYLGRVLEISYNGMAPGGDGYRHPQWLRLRTICDKRPEECVYGA